MVVLHSYFKTYKATYAAIPTIQYNINKLIVTIISFKLYI